MPTENQSHPPLISSQRHLDPETVRRKAQNFKVFVVRTVELELRGRRYRMLIDGHHNLSAARLVGAEPTWRGPAPKFDRLIRRTPPDEFERFMINNLTDSDWYFVETGEVVQELLPRA
ncbi:hypothetical protein SAMN04244579_02427 [Azotobacter beijerinckii]|uniref:Uncharacterized protein n=1 Tax=Azotobacter beijerinckii TaxID=170623 RepID=A0A1H6UG37_9GAMM|nr:hypothetical protein [Azotobacter beijerinckii]SEI91291.1 hypothetical protein SAMN04244579_02427 [Azotobacter beijerinckii]